MEKATILFDDPNNLQITLCYGNRKLVVDILKSVHRDPYNIGHPLITKAIARYALAIRWAALRSQTLTPEQQETEAGVRRAPPRLSKNQARKNLDQIFRALVHDPRLPRTETDITTGELVANSYSSEYFETLASILRDPDVSRIRRPELRINPIELRLKERFPQTDHTYVLDFLKDRRLRLPERSGGKPGAALRNAFVAWFANTEPQTVKAYRSRREGILRRLRPLLRQLPSGASGSLSPQVNEDVRKLMYALFLPEEIVEMPKKSSDIASLLKAVRFVEAIDLSKLFVEPLTK